MIRPAIAILCSSLIVGSGVWYWQQNMPRQFLASEPILGVTTTAPMLHTVVQVDTQHFVRALTTIQAQPPEQSEQLQGGIIPHHMLAAELMADWYARAAQNREVTRVIVIGPDHDEAGPYWASTTTGSWDTGYGTLNADTPVIAALQQNNVVREAPEAVSKEHALTTHMPFIARFLPGVQVVPIMLSAYTTQENVDALVMALMPFIDDKTIVVASVDFSHNLPYETARTYDAVTESYILAGDTTSLLQRAGQSEYLDSPASVATVIQLMNGVGASERTVVQRANSAEYTGDMSAGSTGYMEIAFTHPE